MTRVFAGTCLAALCAVGLSAQSTTGQAQSASAYDAKDNKSVTITGCLKAGEEPNTFVLSNVKLDKEHPPSSATGTAGAAGTSGTAGAAPSLATVRLVGSPAGVKFSEHVGHTVEITGTLQEEKDKPAGTSGTAATGTSGDTTSRSRAASETKGGHALEVRTLKMVSSSCEPGR